MPKTKTMIVVFKETVNLDRSISTNIEFVGDNLEAELKRWLLEQTMAQLTDNTKKK